MAIDLNLKSVVKINTTNTYLRRMQAEFPTVMIGIGAIAVAFWGYYTISEENINNGTIGLGSSIVYAIVITILGAVYKIVALVLVNWENHKYKESWEESLISKSFAFLFVNSYISLFTKAFVF
jgi:membrane protein YdbS with pleckstrin-like domain